ncbi:MAG: hypothetical protein ACKVW3_06570 [Phycisphaerales bacterium]
MIRKVSPIGLEISGDAFVAAQVERRREGLSLRAGVRLERAGTGTELPTREELERLRGVLERQGFVGRRVVAAVPDASLMASTLELPPAESGAPVEQIGRAEFARLHKREPGTFEMSLWPAGAAGRTGQTWMALGCEHAKAEALLAALESADLFPVGLDARAAALARVLFALNPAESGLALATDAGFDGALTVVLQGGMLAYQRFTPECGLRGLREAFAKSTGAEAGDSIRAGMETDRRGENEAAREHADALARDLSAAIAYATHRYQAEVTGLRLSGPGARIPGLSDRLAEAVGVAVSPLAPAGLLVTSEETGSLGADPALATAIGLAMYPTELAA